MEGILNAGLVVQKLFLSSRLKELDKLRLGANPRFSNPLKCAQKNNFNAEAIPVKWAQGTGQITPRSQSSFFQSAQVSTEEQL
ncbi:hypothetical protein CEXT_293591 [Caerostris extrusa]|uniref:Uncharacterized protein n=1 Tax=Caerostris extrusa TaxID=172846 RepID=A0AAV4MST2_CAEEX|nr:hypothetical protein CEXT_293591 [Caerostris extrusa]